MDSTTVNTTYGWNYKVFVFSNWLISLSIRSSKFIHVAAYNRISFSWRLNTMPLYVYTTFCLFIHLWGTLGLLLLLVIVNIVAVKMGVQLWKKKTLLEFKVKECISEAVRQKVGYSTVQPEMFLNYFQVFVCHMAKQHKQPSFIEDLFHARFCAITFTLTFRNTLFYNKETEVQEDCHDHTQG